MSIVSRFPTYAQLKLYVQEDMDLQNEDFISADEFLRLFNDAVDRAEKVMFQTYEDYFLAFADLTLVSGTQAYSLPDGLWGNKIRKVIYRNGDQINECPRMPHLDRFLELEYLNNETDTQCYNWIIFNTTAGAPNIHFAPVPAESGEYIRIYYWRQANRFVDTSDVLDIPEAEAYIQAYVKWRIGMKESRGNPTPSVVEAKKTRDEERDGLIAALTEMVPDDQNEIEPDFSFYREHV